MDILELCGDVSQEVHPGAYSQCRPTLACNGVPPRQSLSSKKCHSHFNLLCHVYYTTYHAILLQVEEPVGQLFGVSFELGWLVGF